MFSYQSIVGNERNERVEIILSKPEGLDLEWTKVVALHLHLFFIHS
jgi:hypothetical protein